MTGGRVGVPARWLSRDEAHGAGHAGPAEAAVPVRLLVQVLLGVLVWLGERTPPIVHRDIKPHNLVMDDAGAVRLVDFGAVREAQSSGSFTVVGTFGYMAPEQARGQADPRSDLYGLGMTLVFLLTKIEPRDIEQRAPKPEFRRYASASKAFLDVVERLIEPIPDARFASAREALAALEETLEEDGNAPDAELIRDIAEREESARKNARRGAKLPKRAKETQSRVVTEELEDGALLTVLPGSPLRGRAWFVLLCAAAFGFGEVFIVFGGGDIKAHAMLFGITASLSVIALAPRSRFTSAPRAADTSPRTTAAPRVRSGQAGRRTSRSRPR